MGAQGLSSRTVRRCPPRARCPSRRCSTPRAARCPARRHPRGELCARTTACPAVPQRSSNSRTNPVCVQPRRDRTTRPEPGWPCRRRSTSSSTPCAWSRQCGSVKSQNTSGAKSSPSGGSPVSRKLTTRPRAGAPCRRARSPPSSERRFEVAADHRHRLGEGLRRLNSTTSVPAVTTGRWPGAT